MSRMAANGSDARDFSTLLKTIRDGVVQLVECELKLLRVETMESVRGLARDLTLMAAGAVAAVFAAGALVAALCVGSALALGAFLPPSVAWWLGPLTVAVLLGVTAVALIRLGRAKLDSRSLKPAATIETLQDNTEWIRDKIS